MVDRYTKRRFAAPATSPVARYYTVYGREQFLDIGDVADLTGLLVELDTNADGTYATPFTDYTMFPRDADLEGRPWNAIYSEAWQAIRVSGGVRVTAKFGWATVPGEVKNATLLQAARIFKRRTSPFGVAGSPETGELRLRDELDVDVKQLLSHLRDLVVA
jgi:hypothetical protein